MSITAALADRRQLPGHPGEDFRDVAHFGAVAFTLQSPGDVQQAAKVAGKHRLGSGGDDVANLVGHHADRDVGVLHAESAAESAADFSIRHLGDIGTDRPQQPSRLLLDAELAQAGATVVIGDRAGDMPRLQAFDTHDIGEEADQFESSFRKSVGARAQVGVVVEQVRQVMLQHASARA